MVRVVRLERTVSWSQTRRDTNFAIPGYSLFCHDTHGGGEKQRFFCLWSFMWSKPLLCHFQQPGEIQQTQASQGFAAFYHDLTRIPPRHSQTTRADNCATPGYALFKCRLRYYTTSSTSVQEQNSMDRRFAAPCYFFFNSAQSRTMTEIPFGMTVRLCLPILCASSSAASSDGA